jgi:hypothetical protein
MTGSAFGRQKTLLPKGKGLTYTESVKVEKNSNCGTKIEEAMLEFWKNPYMVSRNRNPDIFGYNRQEILCEKHATDGKLEPIAECSDSEREHSYAPDDSLP